MVSVDRKTLCSEFQPLTRSAIIRKSVTFSEPKIFKGRASCAFSLRSEVVSISRDVAMTLYSTRKMSNKITLQVMDR